VDAAAADATAATTGATAAATKAAAASTAADRPEPASVAPFGGREPMRAGQAPAMAATAACDAAARPQRDAWAVRAGHPPRPDRDDAAAAAAAARAGGEPRAPSRGAGDPRVPAQGGAARLQQPVVEQGPRGPRRCTAALARRRSPHGAHLMALTYPSTVRTHGLYFYRTDGAIL